MDEIDGSDVCIEVAHGLSTKLVELAPNSLTSPPVLSSAFSIVFTINVLCKFNLYKKNTLKHLKIVGRVIAGTNTK